MDILRQIQLIRSEIDKHNIQYYVYDEPTISDAEYDMLMRKLYKLEKKYPEFITKNSPTQRVGAKPLTTFQTLTHRIPMLSLANAMNENEIVEFDQRVKKSLGINKTIEYVAEPKLDGLAVELVYEKGQFVQGSTRGDGINGENITQNLKTIKSIPLYLNKTIPFPDLLEIRGEVYINHRDFNYLNKKRVQKGKQPFANPRNCAAGSLRQLDSFITAKRPLRIFCYAPGVINNNSISSQKEFLDILPQWGFPVNPFISVGKGISFLIEYYRKMESFRNSLKYDIDGVVFKVNLFSHQKEMGVRSRSPRWAIAGKLKPQQITSKILNIEVSVGRTGAITPVAKLTPVLVGGVIVSNATLHNQDEINRKDIRIGDTVLIQRAGDVIPEVVKVIIQKRIKNIPKYKLPNKCPICHHKVFQSAVEVVIRCQNVECPAQIKGRIEHFVSKNCMDIDGFGTQLINQLVEKKIISSISDIFNLSVKQLSLLDRMAEKSSIKIINSIEKSKSTTLGRFIHSLGIRNVGIHASKILEKTFDGNLKKLMIADKEMLISIHEIGNTMADSILNFFNDKSNLKVINECIKSGVIFSEIKYIHNSNIIGKTFVFTGTLNKINRKKAQLLVEKLGAHVSSSVSNKTNFLIIGSKPGNKLKKAKELDISILSEDEFFDLIKYK